MSRIMRVGRIVALTGVIVVVGAVLSLTAAQGAVSAADGWIELPEPGATSTSAFVVVKNPTMYDVYIMSATTEVAGSIEFRASGAEDAPAVNQLTIPAYGSVFMASNGAHLVLKDLTRPLEEGETIQLTLVTEGGVRMEVAAPVRRE